jgi:hypothetical protein
VLHAPLLSLIWPSKYFITYISVPYMYGVSKRIAISCPLSTCKTSPCIPTVTSGPLSLCVAFCSTHVVTSSPLYLCVEYPNNGSALYLHI